MSHGPELIASASRFAIAAAIVFFAYQLAQISSNLPGVLQMVDGVSEKIDPTLSEVSLIRKEISEVRILIPDILDEVSEVRKSIPPVLNEIAQVRQQIPPILKRVDAIDKQIPQVLQHVNKTVAVVDKTQKRVPDIVATADKAISSLDKTREAVVPLVPQTLEEIRLTRDKLDPTLDRIEELVDDTFVRAQDTIASVEAAGQEASEGAVKGFFTGIIKLPFQLAGTLASPITKTINPDVAKQITEKDIELMLGAGNKAFKSGKADRERTWENPESGNSGSITIVRFFELSGLECIEARVQINNGRRQIHDKLNEFCRNDDGQWTLSSEVK